MRASAILLLVGCGTPDAVCDTWFFDRDGDGAGAIEPHTTCDPPGNSVDRAGDCDDADPSAFPGSPETCNGADDDCDGRVDEERSDGVVLWIDDDGDGFGGDRQAAPCATEAALVDGDCDDADPAIHPDAPEFCGGADSDCDGVDNADDPDAIPGPDWHVDADGDGFGGPQVAATCASGAGNDADCDDAAVAVHPSAIELCNGFDDDCDTRVDDADDMAAENLSTFHPDEDLDLYGAVDVAVHACAAPPGHVADGTDCNDDDASVSPSGVEVCSGMDEDCDGFVDLDDASLDPASELPAWTDADLDGFGDPASPVRACTLDAGLADNDLDCADGDDSVGPHATEAPYNGTDDDCDPTTPDDDLDQDGALLAVDCNDEDASYGPLAPESCDGTDRDCDGLTGALDPDAPVDLVFVDADLDGFGVGGAFLGCPSDGAPADGDCDDALPGVNPLAVDGCGDGIDADCLAGDPVCPPFGEVVALVDAPFMLYGAGANSEGGSAVAGGGDQDGDGDDEIVVGVPLDNQPGDDGGLVRVRQGDPALTGDVAFLTAQGKVLGESEGDRAGTGVLGLRDIDGDGLDDLAVGAEFASYVGIQDGAVYVLAGPIVDDIVASEALSVWYGPVDEAEVGEFLAPGGDVDGSGVVDLLIGGPKVETAVGEGMVWVVTLPSFGDASLDTAYGRIFGDGDLGHGLWGADVDADGLADAVVGGPFLRVGADDNSGTTWWVRGPLAGDLDVADAVASVQGTPGSYLGWSASMGDPDGDGAPDAAVGAREGSDGVAAVGTVSVFPGALVGATALGDATATLVGGAAGDRFGYALVLDGDHDGDGFADLLVGADRVGGGNDGAAYVFYGPLAGSLGAADAGRTVLGDATDEAGASVAWGDFDGDRLSDLLVGAPGCDFGASNAGCAYVLFAVD